MPKIPEEFRVIESSQSRELFQTLLETYYIPLEIWYTRSIIDKVIPRSTRGLLVLTDGRPTDSPAMTFRNSKRSQPLLMTSSTF